MALAALNALEAFLTPLAPQHEEEEHVMQGLSWMDHQVRGNNISVFSVFCSEVWYI